MEKVNMKEQPKDIHGVGVFFPNLFEDHLDYFDSITSEHKLQQLKLGKKPGTAFRRGIYLSRVEEMSSSVRKFHLLRCSTNLDGPTDNFRQTDIAILKKLNELREVYFAGSAQFNHVLAQTYHNSVSDDGKKEKKAKIAVHSDKTKDMPSGGMMAFCTFYKGYTDASGFKEERLVDLKKVGYDYLYGKGETVLTKLRFRLKPDAAKLYPELVQGFELTLYPNSVFMMNLRTNRLYTHEIVPSILPVDKIPTRLGYVVRCSNTVAEHDMDAGKTFIVEGASRRALEAPTKEGLAELRELYYKENVGIEEVSYKGKFYFSMNDGDYVPPML